MKELVENRIDINLPQDFQKVTEETRESIYFLSSLKNLFETHILRPQDYDKKKYKERLDQINKLQKEFKELENIFYYPSKDQILPDGRYTIDIDLNKYIEFVIQYIKLKEKVDELQYEILNYLVDVGKKLFKDLTLKEGSLGNLKLQHLSRLLAYSAFEHSKDEDKFDNYRIYFSNKNDVREFSKEHEYPIRVKNRNYEFLIKKHRTLYKLLKNSEIDFIFGLSKLEEEAQVKKISYQQIDIGKKVKNLTILAIILAIIGLFYGGINTYYLIIDHKDDNNIEKRIEKILIDINNNIQKQSYRQANSDTLLINLIKDLKKPKEYDENKKKH